MKCKLLAAWKRSADEVIEFDLVNFDANTPRKYVAVGFSNDAVMGNELVLACGNTKSAEIYWNNGQTPESLGASINITDYQFSSEDGVVACKIKSAAVIKSGSHSADFNAEYTLLLAGGPYNGPGSISYHGGNKLATGTPVSFKHVVKDVVTVSAKSDIFFKLHGVFMLFAWLCCAGTGMILARYFKQTWKGKQILGKDRWFQAHRGLMTTTVILSLVAVVFILVEVDVKPLNAQNLADNAHPVIGLICVLLAIIQPIMAVFRPHPGDSTRWLFNWAHWAVGNVAHVSGVIAIFLAGTLAKANLTSTEWWSWVMVAYVVLHVLIHLIFTFLWANSVRSRRNSDHQLKEINELNKIPITKFSGEVKLDQEGGSLRKILLLVYFMSAMVLVIVLVVAVFNAE